MNNCDPDDLIMISDLDEIPNPKKIKNLLIIINMVVLFKKISFIK